MPTFKVGLSLWVSVGQYEPRVIHGQSQSLTSRLSQDDRVFFVITPLNDFTVYRSIFFYMDLV